MERIHIAGEQPRTPIIYYASSIHDMLSSRESVISDIKEKVANLPPEKEKLLTVTRTRNGFALELSLPVPTLLGRFFERKPDTSPNPEEPIVTIWGNAALVYIHLVRYFPDENTDEASRQNSLTIHDPITHEMTPKCDVVRLPESIEQKIPEDLRPNFPVLKATSWSSTVVLLNSYRSNGQDQFGLFAVKNQQANQTQKEAIKSFLGRLSLALPI